MAKVAKNQNKKQSKEKIDGKSQFVEEIISKFTVKYLPKIDGEPTYESINQWMQLLYANATTLPTTLGGR